MSYSRRQLEAFGEPFGESCTRSKPGGRVYGGGGGGGQTTTATQYTSNVPEFAKDSFQRLTGQAEALAATPYTPYTGQRQAQFTPLQQQAYQQAGGQQVAGQLAPATGIALGASTSSFTQPGVSQQYMSPYMQNVIALQQQDADRQADIEGTQRAAQFTKSGAFGGSRQAIMDAEAAKNLAAQKDSIMARGLQSAFEAGQGQFNTEMNRGIQGAAALGQLGQTQFGQEMGITDMRNQLGTQQQQNVQKILDQQYADFQAQRDAPYQQLGFLADILRGSGGSTRSVYSQPQTSGLQTIAGLGSLAAGLAKKKGGVIDVKDKRQRKTRAGINEVALSRM